jgi:outer membrane protein assembly factor BamB
VLLIAARGDSNHDWFHIDTTQMFCQFFAWFLLAFSPTPSALASDWPQFRGLSAAGVSDDQNLPDTWNAETGLNIRWKTAIPGLGHASPIVLGNCVLVLTAESHAPDSPLRVGLYGDIESVPTESSQVWQLYGLSKYTGQILWKRTVHEGVPQIKRHTKSTHANSTPATDGIHVVVFLGSEGLYCYDRCGNLLWKRDLGVLDSGYYEVPAAQWGFGSSPIIYNSMVIVQCDVQQNSFVAAFDVSNGQELWHTAREDVPTWSTPTIFKGDMRTELIVNGYKHAGGYDPWTGKELWRLSGGGDIPVPTPVAAHGLIFLSSAHGPQRRLCAIREGATGDITPADETKPGDHIAWYLPQSGTYMQTPIVYGKYLYACADNGVLSCYEASAGKQIYRERLGKGATGFTASAVAAAGKLYFTSENGDIYVVRAGPVFGLLATNVMSEVCMATPAVSDHMLIVRTESHVYSITASQEQARKMPRALFDANGTSPGYRAECECSRRRPFRPLFGFRLDPLGRRQCSGR